MLPSSYCARPGPRDIPCTAAKHSAARPGKARQGRPPQSQMQPRPPPRRLRFPRLRPRRRGNGLAPPHGDSAQNAAAQRRRSASPSPWSWTGWRRRREKHHLPAVGIVTADVCQSLFETGRSSYTCRLD